jgi:phenylpyruvate tautomerase PptA (4-oxalocrotonate tautomerase family)
LFFIELNSLGEVKILPIIEVNMREQSYENRKKIAEGITQVLAELGVPKHAVTVMFKTVNPDHLAEGGQMLDEILAKQKQDN